MGEGSEVPFPVRIVAPLEIVETLDFLAHDGLPLREILEHSNRKGHPAL